MADNPVHCQQTLTWAWTLLDLADVTPDRLLVRTLAREGTPVRRQLEDLGVETITIEPFAPGFPHCNKLQQLLDDRFRGHAVTVFTDTDIAFVKSVDDLAHSGRIAAKVVDLPHPPLGMWRRILEAAQFTIDPQTIETSFGKHTTPIVNRNGGVYVLPGAAVEALSKPWPRWARWLMQRPELLPDGYGIHIDQVSFGLALLELGLRIDDLPLELNCPTHLPDQLPDIAPRVLHYHDRVDASGFLLPVGKAHVDDAVARVNDVIAKRRRLHFDNRSFWEFRYKSAPDLGSGHGSRGEALAFKRHTLSLLVLPADSVIDVGCGDLEVARELSVASYTGVDISEEALAIARRKKPEWRFERGELHDLNLDPADVVVSFDVLIHQPTLAAYRTLLSGLARLARRRLIVSGYNQPPWHQSEITFFHEPLTKSLEEMLAPHTISVAGAYRDVTIAVVDLNRATANR